MTVRKSTKISREPLYRPSAVLLVERDSFSRVIFSQYLRSKGFKVVATGSVAEARGLARKHGRKWHAVISDETSLEAEARVVWETLRSEGVEFAHGILLVGRRVGRASAMGAVPASRVRILAKPVAPRSLIRALGKFAVPPVVDPTSSG